MKKQFNDFISKLKRNDDYYYQGSEPDESWDEKGKVTNLDPKKEIKLLRKENSLLKKPFFDQCLESFRTRRSIRKFSERSFDFESLFKIIESSMQGPCAGNIQNYRIIYLTEKKQRQKVANMALDQCWIADAPVVLLVLRDAGPVVSMYPQDGERYAIQNVAALITNILNLIHMKGLASCWVEACESGPLKEYLSIPDHFEIDAILPIGYPMETSKMDKLEVTDLFYYNTFGKRTK